MNHRDNTIIHSALVSIAVETVCVVGIAALGLLYWGV